MMSIDIKQRLLPDGRGNKPNLAMKPMYLTVHNTDNTDAGATAEAHSRYLLNGSGGAKKSWHYTVDDKGVYQHLRDNEQGWHAGDGTGRGNALSIGVEVCMYAGIDEQVAWRNAAELLATLSIRHSIAPERIVPHRHWSGKACPSRLLPHWQQFIEMVAQAKEAMSGAPSETKPPTNSASDPNSEQQLRAERVKVIWEGAMGENSQGFLIDNKVYVPVREVAKHSGLRVQWEAAKRQVVVHANASSK